MKYIKTLLKLKHLSYDHIHNLICNIHHTDFSLNDYISYNNKNYMIQDENIYAYHIEDTSIYEYIYNTNEHQLLITIDKRDHSFIDITNELIEKGYIDDSSKLYLRNDVFYLEEYTDLLSLESDLPIIYLNNQFNDEEFIVELQNKVKAMAYVVYGSDAFYEQAPSKSMIIFKHKEVLPFTYFHKETSEQLIERLFTKIQNYMCKYEYHQIYSMNHLYHKALDKMMENTKHKESMLEMTLEEKLLSLEIEKDEYLEKIYKLQSDILLLQNQIEDYRQFTDTQDEHPLLYKGKEKEFYSDEQKEIVLSLILKKLETTTDEQLKSILSSIIDDNPSSNLRKEKLDEIKRLLTSSKKMNSRLIEDLKAHGPTLERHASNHYFFSFYNDSRYLIDIASSPSDINWSRQAYRSIRKYCF